MPFALNAKLLRALEMGEVVPVGSTAPVPHGARVVAATNVDLLGRVARGEFREDLYARLAHHVIELPPLRRRREDILLLFAHIFPEAPPLAPSLAEALLDYDWPRNVRDLSGIASELRSRAEGCERLELDLVRGRLVPASPVSEPLIRERGEAGASPAPDRARLEELLREHDGNVAAVARAVGRSRTQAYRLLEQHGLVAKAYRTS